MTDDGIIFLEELLRIPSLSGQEDAVADYLLQEMRRLGFLAYRDQVGNVIGEVGDPEASKTLALLGHMDTVAGAIPVRQAEGCLYGRGSVDAKGPLAAFVLAAAQVQSQLDDCRVLVIGAVEEEAHSRGAHHLVETLKPPDGVIIGEPSGWQGITLGYKGILRLNYQLCKAAGHGAGYHSPPAEEAVVFWNRLVEYAAEYNQDHRPPRFDTLDLSLQSFCTKNDGLEDSAQIEIGLRLPMGFKESTLKKEIRGWSDAPRVTFPYYEPPFRAEKNTSVVRALLRAIRSAEGQPRFKLKTGTSDMNVVGPYWGCPIAAYGPGDSSLDHTPDEHIRISEFQRGVMVLAKMITYWQ